MACSSSQQRDHQFQTLQGLVIKHLGESSVADFANSGGFALTSTERGISRWEQAHLAAALDALNDYQTHRRARAARILPAVPRQFRSDPRTRTVEFLKQWLRAHAVSKSVGEQEVRGVSGFCRDLLNHANLFPARNPRSFLCTIAEVYDHLQRQLREALKSDRACADLARRVLSLGRNFVSDVMCFLLLAPTDLWQTDALPSLEVVSLWQSLPGGGCPLPGSTNPALQRTMCGAWRTMCGSLIAEVLSSPWCVNLFKGTGAEDQASSHPEAEGAIDDQPRSAPSVASGGQNVKLPNTRTSSAACERISRVKRQFELGELRDSGLAGAFRSNSQHGDRQRYVEVVQNLFDLVYLLGVVLVQFHHISSHLGDYGMIRVAPWLHPFLDALTDKVQRIKCHLEVLNDTVEGSYILPRARGAKVDKPAPTSRMIERAHASLERAVTGQNSHAQALLQTIEDLRTRSSPERLPHVMEGLGDTCTALQGVLESPEFRARAGHSFHDLPTLGNVPKVAAADSDVSVSTECKNSNQLHLEAPSEADDAELKASVSMSSGLELWTDVQRMGPAGWGHGAQQRDCRTLGIADGHLLIYDKGSRTEVKMAVDIQDGIDLCRLESARILSVVVRYVPEGASKRDGAMKCKLYTFEFPTVQLAEAFHDALSSDMPVRLQDLCSVNHQP